MMKARPINEVKTAGEAEEIAMDWQDWASEQSLSYAEIAEWQAYFKELGGKFNLTEVFEENGII